MTSTNAPPRLGLPDLGFGVGLRVPHYRHILEHRPEVDFFEVISENFMVGGGKPLYHLDRMLETYRVVQHGVALSLGGPDAPDRSYLRRLKDLVRRIQPPWLSDHFCWCGAGGAHLHDLLPMPYSKEALFRIVERAKMVQDFLELRLALENTSTYLEFTSSTMTEWEFISEVAEQADIGLLLDVNNVYVSAYNHGFDPHSFIHNIPHERILQIHLAGHSNFGRYIIDTHSGPVIDPVWDLYRETIKFSGSVSTLIEWDDEIPEFQVVLAEAERARGVRDAALQERASARHNGSNGAELRPYALEQECSDIAAPWKQRGARELAE